ncbi:MAG: ABC transporter permease [Planctomycetota bacterium]
MSEPTNSTGQHKSYWAIVRQQFAKNRLAVFASRCVVFLVLLAVYAPVLASDRPFLFWGPGEHSLPWLRDLFDHNEYSQPIDLFFNLLIFYLPIAYIIFMRIRKHALLHGTWTARRSFRLLGLKFAILVWLFLGVYLPDSVVDSPSGRIAFAPGRAIRSSKPVVDYHEKIAELKASNLPVFFLFPPAPYYYDKTRNKEQLLEPDYYFGEPSREVEGVVGPHILGTDVGGKDVFAMLIFGTRISMTVGVIAVALYCTIGIIAGSVAGFFGGWVDALISRLVEIFMSFPFLVFILTVVAVFESKSIFLVMAAIGLISWTGVARLVRGEFLTQRNQEYVLAARALGIPQRRVIFRHVLPNSLTPVLVAATFGVAAAILAESTISFLGLGDPLAASWGKLLNLGRQNTQSGWLIFPPGVAIFFTVTVFNLVGEGLRDALDPKLRQ